MNISAINLYGLLENLLDWARIQRGITSFAPESFLLMPKMAESMQTVLESVMKKQIQIIYEIPDNLEVYADGNMLGSTIRNLASNAVKFTPQGGKVTITAKQLPGNAVEISISDTGIGMNKRMIDNLFSLDEQTNRKGTEGEPSTGLGLIICKDFVEKHGGKIWAESEKAKGSTFHFTLLGKPIDLKL
jgi:signal transduction histidine kinase